MCYRLSSLQHSEKHWQSRVPLRESNSRRPASRPPVSIADRLSQLSEAQQTWTAKVKDKDVKKYTADEKLGRLNGKSFRSFVYLRQRRRSVRLPAMFVCLSVC